MGGTLLRSLLPFGRVAACLLLACWVPQIASQVLNDQQLLSSYLGQNVASIEVAGQPDETYDKLRDAIAVKPGQPLRQADIETTIARLKQQANISNASLTVEPQANGVQVTFVLEPAVYVGMYEFPGATSKYDYSRLLQVASYPTQSPYSNADVRQAEDALSKFFQQDGYFESEVRAEAVIDSTHNLVNVLFNTTLGRRAKVGQIQLEGASPDETAYLRGKLHSFMARLRASYLKPGMTFSHYRLKNATHYMEEALTKQNYATGTVKLVSADYDPGTNRADVTFHIDTGPVVKVQTAGAKIGQRKLRDLVPIYAANSADTDLVNEGGRSIQLYFQNKGYFDVQVATRIEDTSSGKLITYAITKGQKHKVKEVAFAGNKHYTDKELQTQVPVEKARFFSHGKYSDKLVRTGMKNLEALYQSAGYSDVKVIPDIKREGGNIEVAYNITEGQRDVVHDLRIEGNTTLSEAQFAPDGLRLGPGKPYSQKLVDEDRNHILAHCLALGYLSPGFTAKASAPKGQPHQLSVVYQITEGPQVKIAQIVTVGRDHTRPELIDRQIPFHSGEPMSQNAMMKSEAELYNLNVFDWAEIDPKAPVTDATKQDDVVVKVHERKRNSIEYGFGFEVINRGGSVPGGTVLVPGIPPVGLPNTFKTSEQTFWGPRGLFEYTRRNVRGRGETYTVTGYAARLDQRAGFSYTDPYFRGTSWKGSALANIEHNAENPIFTARIGNIGYQLEKALNAKKTTNIFFRYNFQLNRISNLLIPELVPANQLNVRLSTLSASYIHDTRDNVLDAHRGWYATAEFDVNPAWLGSNFSFAKFLAQIAHYKNIGHGIIWANSLRVGLEQAYAGSEVPVSQKFFTGGASTLRGFPLNGAGPQETIPACGNPNDPSTCVKITVPQGGNELLLLNSELRFPLDSIKKGLGIVAFYDGGNVFPSVGFHDFGSLYTNSVGLGLRYATPIGPVRIDVGHNLNPVPGIQSTQYFITIGQAF
jgi:outer membrane protein insertion porin family